MTKLLTKILFIFSLLICSLAINALNKESNEVEAWDRSQINYRHPSNETMETYKQMDIYRYDRFEQPTSFWDYIIRWILSKLAGVGVNPKFLIYSLIGLAALILLFVILKLLGININGLFIFSRDNKITNLMFHQNDDNIYNEDLEQLLAASINNKAYRDAVRILYLLCIRLLDSNSLIEWKPWKTNKEYYYELSKADQKKIFKKLVLNYEYIWYGQFKLEESKFNLVQQDFESFNKLIRSKGA